MPSFVVSLRPLLRTLPKSERSLTTAPPVQCCLLFFDSASTIPAPGTATVTSHVLRSKLGGVCCNSLAYLFSPRCTRKKKRKPHKQPAHRKLWALRAPRSTSGHNWTSTGRAIELPAPEPACLPPWVLSVLRVSDRRHRLVGAPVLQGYTFPTQLAERRRARDTRRNRPPAESDRYFSYQHVKD